MLVFILEDALSVWKNCLPLFDLNDVQSTEDSSSRRIMRLVPVFILETNNQTNNECLSKFVQTDNASSSINTAIFNTYLKMSCRMISVAVLWQIHQLGSAQRWRGVWTDLEF